MGKYILKNSIRLFTVIITAALLFSFVNNDITKEINNAIKLGDAKIVKKYFNDNLEVSMPGNVETEIVSKDQAEAILKSFFAKHPVKSLEMTQAGNSNTTNQFYTGKVITSKGTYKINYLLKNGKISQFKIESYNE